MRVGSSTQQRQALAKTTDRMDGQNVDIFYDQKKRIHDTF